MHGVRLWIAIATIQQIHIGNKANISYVCGIYNFYYLT